MRLVFLGIEVPQRFLKSEVRDSVCSIRETWGHSSFCNGRPPWRKLSGGKWADKQSAGEGEVTFYNSIKPAGTKLEITTVHSHLRRPEASSENSESFLNPGLSCQYGPKRLPIFPHLEVQPLTQAPLGISIPAPWQLLRK